MNTNINSSLQEKLRTFSPMVLFHDHQFVKKETGRLERICIPGGGRFHGHLIEIHKKRIQQMLEDNGRFWADVRANSSTSGSSNCSSRRSSVSSGYNNSNIKQSPPSTPPLYSHGVVSPTVPSRTRHYAHPYRRHLSLQVQPHHLRQATMRRTPLMNHSTTSTTAGPVMSSAGVPDNASTSSSSSLPPSPISPSPSSKDFIHKKSRPHGPAKRRRGNLPKHVTAILREWLARHKKHPYPTEEEKSALATQTNLTLNQISNWFINARRRILQPMIVKEEQERMLGHIADDDDDGDSQYTGLDILPYIGDHQRPGSPQQGHRKSHHLVASSRYSPVARRRAALRQR